MKELIKQCGEITKAKGFDCTQHLKQLLLIADEVGEAIEHVIMSRANTNRDLQIIRDDFMTNMSVLRHMRKTEDMHESTMIENKQAYTEELADIIIRVFSYCSVNELDLENAVVKKIEKNKNRIALHGKKF